MCGGLIERGSKGNGDARGIGAGGAKARRRGSAKDLTRQPLEGSADSGPGPWARVRPGAWAHALARVRPGPWAQALARVWPGPWAPAMAHVSFISVHSW